MNGLEAAAPAATPSRVGQFSILSHLADGGMASVFLARRDGEERVCVLKWLHVELGQDPRAGQRFQREAEIAARIRHPGVAQLLYSGIEDGRFVIAMEYIPGKTLGAILERCRLLDRTLPIPTATWILSELLDALGHVHGLEDEAGRPLGVVHRDLSPHNVMCCFDGSVKIIDFGVARAELGDFKTGRNALIGTPTYMSPEQAMTVPVDHRTDIYSAGLLLAELLTLEPLVKPGPIASVLHSVIAVAPPPIRETRGEVSGALEAAILKALAKTPEARFQSAREFREALAAATTENRGSPRAIAELMGQLFSAELSQKITVAHDPARARTAHSDTRVDVPESFEGASSMYGLEDPTFADPNFHARKGASSGEDDFSDASHPNPSEDAEPVRLIDRTGPEDEPAEQALRKQPLRERRPSSIPASEEGVSSQPETVFSPPASPPERPTSEPPPVHGPASQPRIQPLSMPSVPQVDFEALLRLQANERARLRELSDGMQKMRRLVIVLGVAALATFMVSVVLGVALVSR